MRPASVAGWLLALCVTTISAAPPTREGETAVLAKEVAGETLAEDGEAVDYTIFNDLKVPPMIEIEGDKFAETVKDGYWYARQFCT
jgi:hypothetical protein